MKAFLTGRPNIIAVDRLFWEKNPLARSGLRPYLFLLASFFLFSHQVFADSYFDFDEINAPKKKNAHSAAIDAYMERVYGSEITVGPGAQVAGPRAPKSHARATAASSPPSDSYLINGKGKNSAITLSFDASPLTSFSVDSQVFKKGVGLIIKADGVIIYQHLLTKAEKRSGIMDSIDPIFFDTPIHSLTFIGINKTKIAIDDLAVNFATGDPEGELAADEATQVQVASVPEPSSLILLGLGLFAASWLSRWFGI